MTSLVSSLGRNEEALKDIEANPRDGWLHYHRALVLDGLGSSADALAEVERALRTTPELAPLWALKGRILARLGRHTEAPAAVNTALQHNPKFAPALQLKAELAAGQPRSHSEPLDHTFLPGHARHVRPHADE